MRTELTAPDENEETRLKARIDEFRAAIATSAAELAELQATLGAFEARYDARIGALIVELDRINLAIEEYQRRIQYLSQPPDKWQAAEEEIQHEFRSERERVEAEYAETRSANERVSALPPEPEEDASDQIRKLYRKLARQYHPDVAVSDTERRTNEHVMKRINAAMDARDLDALIRLELELPHKKSAIYGNTTQARIAWALKEITRLEAVLVKLEGDLASIRASSLYQLWERSHRDPEALYRLEKDLSDEIRDKRSGLENLMQNFRDAVSRRKAADEIPL